MRELAEDKFKRVFLNMLKHLKGIILEISGQSTHLPSFWNLNPIPLDYEELSNAFPLLFWNLLAKGV